ncbi:MAG: PEP-CTERM sorting domain-containing protein [Akkermansiaceae bacterium]|nr:PEP-CTERM sorting domain-containing protein [Akkermansiaceae bacterium]
MNILPFTCASVALALLPCQAAIIQITPGVNNMAIKQVVLTIGGTDVTQNTEETVVTRGGSNSPINVKSVNISDGSPVNVHLSYFNTEAAKVVNVDPNLANSAGIGVFNNGVTTKSATNNISSYATAFAGTSTDTDLRNYAFNDYVTPARTTNTPQLDILFYRALTIDDYVLVSERWGNSAFQVTALDVQGKPYASGNTLKLGGNGGSFYTAYDWNTGVASKDSFQTQAQALTVFSVAKFFEQLDIDPQRESFVWGLRIINDGEADAKILGISANSFLDNPINPLVPIPEPSSGLLILSAGMFFLGSRKRQRVSTTA